MQNYRKTLRYLENQDKEKKDEDYTLSDGL
jgi:hypothetical protein